MSRRVLALALLGVFVSIGSASASTPSRLQIEFFKAPEGPASAFSFLQHHAPLTPSLQVTVTARARRIDDLRLGGRDHVLLVAPTKGGGFCTSLSGPYGGTVCAPGKVLRAHGAVLDPAMVGDASGPILFDGYFTVRNAARLEVRFQDGTTNTIPFVWVGKPISAGFFLYDLTSHRRPGHRPSALTLLSREGNQLYRARLRR